MNWVATMLLLFVVINHCLVMLQAFSNRLFYNKDTGYFEQVHKDGVVCWDGNITPSSSLSTLYLPEDTMGAVSGPPYMFT